MVSSNGICLSLRHGNPRLLCLSCSYLLHASEHGERGRGEKLREVDGKIGSSCASSLSIPCAGVLRGLMLAVVDFKLLFFSHGSIAPDDVVRAVGAQFGVQVTAASAGTPQPLLAVYG